MAESSPQLDRIEAALASLASALRRIDQQNQQQTGYLVGLVNGVQLMAQSVTDLAAQIDAATNSLAAQIDDEGTRLDALGAKLGTEGQAITDVAARVAAILQQLQDLKIPQAVLDQLGAVVTRLGTSASTVTSGAAAIDAATTALDAHVSSLQGIPATIPAT